MKTKCPTCEGCGEVELAIEANIDSIWSKYCGDKDLWEKYSHASIRNDDGSWSKYYRIAAFYRYGEEYGLNFWEREGGSWPICTETELKDRFRFVDRKTGDVVIFDTKTYAKLR